MTLTRPLPSNRSFGLMFAAVFAGLSAWSYYKGLHAAQVWADMSLLVLLATLLVPNWLTPFNRSWMWLGSLMNRIISPVVMGILYFCLIVPVGLGMRLAGRDPLRLSLDPTAQSYWIERDPPGPAKESFLRQF
jgi:Saxitoxin biosynthesis operon protein SxtJ